MTRTTSYIRIPGFAILAKAAVFTTVIILAFIVTSARALEENPELGGSIEAVVEGKRFFFPALKTDINADVQGDLATVTVTQTFDNPSDKPLNAKYLFPLNHDAAVYSMVMEVGDEIVQAQIQKIEEALKTFEKARNEGKAASLLVQHRPNMFTQNIANLMPNLPIKVTIKYVQTLPKIDNEYELVLPLVVGPRYQPANAEEPPVQNAEISSKTKFDQWEVENLPSYPDVSGLTIPDMVEKDRVSLLVTLNGGMKITNLHSDTHKIKVTGDSDEVKQVSLTEGRIIDNRDFILRYSLAGEKSQAGLLAHKDERGGFFSLLIEPPVVPMPEDITSREIVFVLDTSGSMSGLPIEASKSFMRHALTNLRATDYFRIIRFSNNATEFTSAPVLATQENIQRGLQFVNSLTADGGTEAMAGLTQAFSIYQQPNTLRVVVFLSDGYIGNEFEVLRLLNEKMGSARIYTLGVGTGVNRYLLDEMARIGRGYVRIIDPTENAEDAVQILAKKLETPVLTDISIDWGTLKSAEIVPQQIPDLFAGSAIRIQGKYDQGGKHTITVKGMVNGRKAQLPVTIDLLDNSVEKGSAIPLIWARSQISEYMRELTNNLSRKTALSDTDIKQKIAQLGLDFALVTKWTSFVAVSKKVMNERSETALDTNVPLHMVKGVTARAYGESDSNNVTQQNQSMMMAQVFSGSSTPEPVTIGGMAVMAGAAGISAFRRRRRK